MQLHLSALVAPLVGMHALDLCMHMCIAEAFASIEPVMGGLFEPSNLPGVVLVARFCRCHHRLVRVHQSQHCALLHWHIVTIVLVSHCIIVACCCHCVSTVSLPQYFAGVPVADDAHVCIIGAFALCDRAVMHAWSLHAISCAWHWWCLFVQALHRGMPCHVLGTAHLCAALRPLSLLIMLVGGHQWHPWYLGGACTLLSPCSIMVHHMHRLGIAHLCTLPGPFIHMWCGSRVHHWWRHWVWV